MMGRPAARSRTSAAVTGSGRGSSNRPARSSTTSAPAAPARPSPPGPATLASAAPAAPGQFDALSFASTSSPYNETQVASVIATAADLPREAAVADLGGSVRAGLGALRAALDGVRAGSHRTALG